MGLGSKFRKDINKKKQKTLFDSDILEPDDSNLLKVKVIDHIQPHVDISKLHSCEDDLVLCDFGYCIRVND